MLIKQVLAYISSLEGENWITPLFPVRHFCVMQDHLEQSIIRSIHSQSVFFSRVHLGGQYRGQSVRVGNGANRPDTYPVIE